MRHARVSCTCNAYSRIIIIIIVVIRHRPRTVVGHSGNVFRLFFSFYSTIYIYISFVFDLYDENRNTRNVTYTRSKRKQKRMKDVDR